MNQAPAAEPWSKQRSGCGKNTRPITSEIAVRGIAQPICVTGQPRPAQSAPAGYATPRPAVALLETQKERDPTCPYTSHPITTRISPRRPPIPTGPLDDNSRRCKTQTRRQREAKVERLSELVPSVRLSPIWSAIRAEQPRLAALQQVQSRPLWSSDRPYCTSGLKHRLTISEYMSIYTHRAAPNGAGDPLLIIQTSATIGPLPSARCKGA